MTTNSGHGHVFRNTDGTKARCGGPGICSACRADLDRFVASADVGPIASRFNADLAVEIQACCDRASVVSGETAPPPRISANAVLWRKRKNHSLKNRRPTGYVRAWVTAMKDNPPLFGSFVLSWRGLPICTSRARAKSGFGLAQPPVFSEGV